MIFGAVAGMVGVETGWGELGGTGPLRFTEPRQKPAARRVSCGGRSAGGLDASESVGA